jgi:hypothetical protein
MTRQHLCHGLLSGEQLMRIVDFRGLVQRPAF